MCDNLVNTLKLLANQQTGGDSPAYVLVEGFQERSQFKLMEESRMCITMDDHEAVKIGDFGKDSGIASGGEGQVHHGLP